MHDDIYNAMINQPILNIGMIGHVSNGKSTITKCLTGITTQRHSSEKQKNITIKLGYANAKIYKCGSCPEPEAFQCASSKTFDKACDICNASMELITHVSFVDCPGHIKFMSTMLNGTSIMDTTILVESICNENLPAPQTEEHIRAITIGQIPNSVICLNKFDLIKEHIAIKNIQILKKAFENTIVSDSPMVPISGTLNINVDILCYYISQIPVPVRDISSPYRMVIVRSFNINKPGTEIDSLSGAVIGGTILCGKVSVNDIVELRPGYCTENTDESSQTRWNFIPLVSKIISINSETNQLQYAIPGGLIGIQLDIDSALASNDGLIGQILVQRGIDNNSHQVYEELAISYKTLADSIIKKNDEVVIHLNACNINCKITKIYEDNILKLKLEKPICASVNDKFSLCSDGKIFGVGKIIEGKSSREVRQL